MFQIDCHILIWHFVVIWKSR